VDLRRHTAAPLRDWLRADPIARLGPEADSWEERQIRALSSLEGSGTLTTLSPGDAAGLEAFSHLPLRTDVDEAAARRSLRGQIARLERELAAMFTSAHPRQGLDWQVGSPGGPRLLGVGELEALRDDLAARLEDTRQTLSDRTRVERRNVARIEQMVAEPERFKWVRISNADIGEPACKHWHSRPRFGLIGMLMGWWRVKISSGCP
jgi:hypothetical protein